MQRDNLKLVQPTEDRTVEIVRSAVRHFVDQRSDEPGAPSQGGVSYRIQRQNLMAEPSVLAAIGAALAIGREPEDVSRSVRDLNLYSLGLNEAHRARIAGHAAHPQRPVWLASGVHDQCLALWMYATCRMLLENTACSRVFLEDLAEALRIPVRDVRILKQMLPLRDGEED